MPATQITEVAKATERGPVMDFSSIPAGCLTTGTFTGFGRIEAVTLTAYRIDGEFVPFARVHGRAPMADILADFNWEGM